VTCPGFIEVTYNGGHTRAFIAVDHIVSVAEGGITTVEDPDGWKVDQSLVALIRRIKKAKGTA